LHSTFLQFEFRPSRTNHDTITVRLRWNHGAITPDDAITE
jgi:hypothetical protein